MLRRLYAGLKLTKYDSLETALEFILFPTITNDYSRGIGTLSWQPLHQEWLDDFRFSMEGTKFLKEHVVKVGKKHAIFFVEYFGNNSIPYYHIRMILKVRG